jgi:hypothetical protein
MEIILEIYSILAAILNSKCKRKFVNLAMKFSQEIWPFAGRKKIFPVLADILNISAIF